MSSKPKCKYWDKCYRKEPAHKKNFLHPCDVADDSTDSKMDTADDVPPKPSLRRAKTHELSFRDSDNEDNDVEMKDANTKTSLKKRTSRRSSTTSASSKKDKPKAEKEDDDIEEDVKPGTSGTGDDDVKPGTSGADDDDSSKPKCVYWDLCYRKDPNHLKTYRHPSRRVSSRPKAEKRLDDGESVKIQGGFTLKRNGSDFQCTCIGWKTQKNATNKRTCKHLREYLGDTYEKARVGKLPVEKRKPPEPSQHFSHITISLLLAHKYDEKAHNPVGWWVSEKLDGVRAFWNGKCFYSRLGNPFIAPRWFTKDLPKDMHLDGELFGGRKKFQSTVSIVKTPECDQWKKIKYCVFDAPHLSKEPFEKRTKAVKEYFDENNPQYAEFCEQTKCTSKDQLEKDLKKIIALGGEGLMIRQPGSLYERKRSHTLLKLKKFYDAEAVVIGYDPGKGRFQGAVGALRCKMECGKIFSVGSGLTDKDHRRPPKIGSIITYKFQEYTNSGSPRFPTYLGVRIDATGPKDADVPKTVADA